MNIIPSFLFRKDFRDSYRQIALDENRENEHWQFEFACDKKNGKLLIRLCATLKQAISVDGVLRLKFTLDNNETIQKIINPFPDCTFKSFAPSFIQIETDQRQLLLKTVRPFPYKILGETQNTFSLDFIIDAPFLHPAWDYQLGQRRSTAATVQPAGTSYYFEASITEFSLSENLVPIQQSNHPFGCLSTFILTDHCDFDTTEKLRLFLHGNNNDGWLGKGLKITKGVFTLGPRNNEPVKNASLEEEDYNKLILALQKDGSEIVPHALKSKGQLNSELFHDAIKSISERFQSKTWIDHGCYLKYCYSQGSKDNADYLLVKTLQRYKYNNLWAYHDVNTDALNTLDIFTVSDFGSARIFKRALRHLASGKWLIGAHFIRGILHRNYTSNIIKDYAMYAMARSKGIFINLKQKKKTFRKDLAAYFKSFTAFKKYHHNEIVPYRNDDVLKYCSPLYTEERKPLHQWKDGDLIMFNTFETTHLLDIYNEAALKNLMSTYGTHIGHTYILNDLPYIHSIFTRRNGELVLAKQWTVFTKILSEYISKGWVWNPNMGEYVAYILSLQKITIAYQSANKMIVTNHNLHQVEGYTIIIPHQFERCLSINGVEKYADRSDDHYHFFVLDLPAQSDIHLTYQSIKTHVVHEQNAAY